MERLPHLPEEEAKKPGEAGGIEAPKKRRRKTRVPLKKTVKKETEKQSAKEKDGEEDKKPNTIAEVIEAEKETREDTEESSVETAADTPLELPELPTEELKVDHEPTYQGELVIDHAENLDNSGETEPEEVHSFEALLDPAEAEATAAEVKEEEVAEAPPRVAPPLLLPIENIVTAPSAAEAEAHAFEPASNSIVPVPVRRIFDSFAARQAESAPSDTETVTKEDADDRAYRAEKRGLSRGVVTGGLVGWLIGRRGKRALEREAKAAVDSRDKSVSRLIRERDSITDRLSRERDRAVESADKHLESVKRTQSELREMLKEKWDKQVLRRPSIEIPFISKAEKPTPVYESARPVFETVSNPTPEKLMPIKPEAKKTDGVENEKITEETYIAPEGRRVETSAWHRIEVDEKTGKVIENPSVAYGEAFKKEKQQEKLASDAAKAQTAAQVGMTLLMNGTEETTKPMVPQEFAKQNAVIEIVQPKVDIRREAAYAVRTIAKQTSSPVTWAVALALVLALFLMGVLG